MNQPIQPQTTALARVDDRMRNLATPETTDDIFAIAERMHHAGLVPSSIKSVDGAFLAMMKGAEYGLLPQQSLAGFYVVNNIAFAYGTCLSAIVQSSPTYEDEMEGCIEGIEEMRYMATEENSYPDGSSAHRMFAELQRELRRRVARVEGKLKDSKVAAYYCGWSVMLRKGKAPVAVLFDSFEAQKAGLLTKSGPWVNMPHRMHMHRAAGFNRKSQFSKALVGLEMTAEEAMDTVIDLGTQPAPAPRPEPGTPTQVLRDLVNREPAPARERIVDMTPAKPAPAAARPVETTAAPVERSVVPDPVDPLPAAPAEPPPGASVVHGLAGLNGTELLKAVCQRIKAAGDDAAPIMQAACMEVLKEIKPSKAMTAVEKGLVAVEIARLYDDAQAAKARYDAHHEGGDPGAAEADRAGDEADENQPPASGLPPELDDF